MPIQKSKITACHQTNYPQYPPQNLCVPLCIPLRTSVLKINHATKLSCHVFKGNPDLLIVLADNEK